MAEPEIWRPGSFTKNFSWGPLSNGLKELHTQIKIAFSETGQNLERTLFRNKMEKEGRPDYIPLNFFLYNFRHDGTDYLLFDELVFQATNFRHGTNFDRLAIFAFNLSIVGSWKGTAPEQRRPALWANAYIRERVAKQLHWDVAQISANDIERFVVNDPRYKAKTSRKLATNLNYLYKAAHLDGFKSDKIERWWVNALFLALDRMLAEREAAKLETKPAEYMSLLTRYGFMDLTGGKSLGKELAIKHLVRLYVACGGLSRFSEENIAALLKITLPDMENYLANDTEPGAAIHPTNPNILKTLPRACAMLAKEAGFLYLSGHELADLNVEEFVRRSAREALRSLKEENIRPTMSATELLKLTRER